MATEWWRKSGEERRASAPEEVNDILAGNFASKKELSSLMGRLIRGDEIRLLQILDGEYNIRRFFGGRGLSGSMRPEWVSAIHEIKSELGRV